jgi:hypothetical protein
MVMRGGSLRFTAGVGSMPDRHGIQVADARRNRQRRRRPGALILVFAKIYYS